MKVLTVVGARPQFVKSAPVSKALNEAGVTEYLVHTGQHYDYRMSGVFFDDLGISHPDVNLEVGSGLHGWQTGNMLIRLEETVVQQKPNWVLVYGDTNSTLAGALVAVKLHVPLAHVEAGLRSFNRNMPEEHNRVLTDHCSDLLFCPTQTAVDHLRNESISDGIRLVGDTMYDAVLMFAEYAQARSTIMHELDVKSKEFALATVHRPYNTDVSENLHEILLAFQELNWPVIFPVHPRTRQKIADLSIRNRLDNIRMIDPVGYLDMLTLEQNARVILTDSGGMQKEAYFFAIPCVTLRPETEWEETLENGWNVLVAADRDKILAHAADDAPLSSPSPVFGDGKASYKIVEHLSNGVRLC